MTLAPGTRLGPYEIMGSIGAGGMGEVYRAKDGRLDRLVAVKVLPRHLQESPDALARFEREAKAVAALSHPNILGIFDFGSADPGGGPIAFATMELLEGETLRSRLKQGPLPVRKAFEVALQMAQGLGAAHDKGIVHRDLKPDNIFLTREGRVKLLDFGLAKQVKVWKDLAGSQTPTAVGRPETTEEGMVLGTVGYMSPEQVKGADLDHRSDIFSFGSVLFEMLSGRRAFQRDTAVQTMSAILTEDPPELEQASAVFAPALDRIIRHCMEKVPEQRFQSAHDLAFALQSAQHGQHGSGATSTKQMFMMGREEAWKPLARRGAWAILGLAALGAAAFWGRRSAHAEPPRFHQLTYLTGTVQSARFAPDGQNVLYSAAFEGRPEEVFATRTDFPDSRPVGLGRARISAMTGPGLMAVTLQNRRTDPGVSTGTLAEVPLQGGTPREIAEGSSGADYSEAAKAWALITNAAGRYALEFPKGRRVFESSGYLSHVRISPDGQRVAFLNHPVRADDRGFVMLLSPDGTTRTLSQEWSSVQGLAWNRDGSEVWFTGSEAGPAYTLWGANLKGQTRPILRIPGGLMLFDVAKDGRTLLGRVNRRTYAMVQAPGDAAPRNLSWLDASETTDISADGERLLFYEWGQAAGKDYTVCLRKTDGSSPIRLGTGSSMSLSPDGKWALAVILSAPRRLMMWPTGAGEAKEVPVQNIQVETGADWLPDSRGVVFSGHAPGKGTRMWVQSLAGGAPRPVTPEGVGFDYGSHPVSPDGKSVVGLGGDGRAFLYPLDGNAEPRPLKNLGGTDQIIRWQADGKGIFVHRMGGVPVQIERYDLASGTRTPHRQVMPVETSGVSNIGGVQLTPDGKTLAFTVNRLFTDLYLVEGLR